MSVESEGLHLKGREGEKVNSTDGRLEGTGTLQRLTFSQFGVCWGVVMPDPDQGAPLRPISIRADLLTPIER